MTAVSTSAAPAAKEKRAKRGFPGLAQLQRIGRALMMPIASMPAAALLMRLGQPDMLGANGVSHTFSWMQPVADVLAAAGNGIFNNLPIIFAVGVAIGFAKKSDGSTALAAVIGYLVFTGVTDAMSLHVLKQPTEAGAAANLVNYGVLGGIVIGVTAALLYQRFYRIKLPPYLAFFGGRRFVPIITAGVAVLVGVVMSFIYPAFDWAFNKELGNFVTGNTVIGGFVFGTLNRLLVPFGLHHLLNSLPWFQFGSYTNAAGNVFHGDIPRFLAGDPTAGAFQTGFFPIMMFAIPAICLAFVHTAKSRNRKIVAGMMGSAALVAFVTGVTEPVEFAFAYVAYPLYAVHAVLTGSSLALVNWLGIKDGFGFSAGVIDYLLNFRIATYPLWLIVIGLGYAVIYYVVFRFAIQKFNLHTPGREEDGDEASTATFVDEMQAAAEAEDAAKKEAARLAAAKAYVTDVEREAAAGRTSTHDAARGQVIADERASGVFDGESDNGIDKTD